MNVNLNKALAIALTCVLLAGRVMAQDKLILTQKQEKYLSKTTVSTHMMGTGTFSSFASYLYAQGIATIHTDNPEVTNIKLRSFPDPDSKVSLRELFDEITRQTSSKWTYDRKHDYWLFTKPLPFEIEIAQGWEKEAREGYIFFKPPTAPVGMDIYIAACDTMETPHDARIRIAKKFAEPITPGITADAMTEVSLQHHNALFYKTSIAKKGIIWRQWVITEKEGCFVIVSAIKPHDEPSVLPDVEKMVQSFKLVGMRQRN